MNQPNTARVNATQPTIFFGLDGAEPKLIKKWIAEGMLPNIAKIYKEGLSGDIKTLPGFGDGATWPTLITGVNPGRHGRYFRRQFKPGSYRGKVYDIETDMLYEPFWTALGRAGKSVAILDLPYANITECAGSLQLANWHIHDRYSEPSSHPADFVRKVYQEFGDDPVNGDSDQWPRDARSLAKLTEALLERIDAKEKLVVKVLKGEQRDLMMTSFAEPHDIGHMCWHYHDANSPYYDPEWVAEYGDPLKRIYTRIDEAIGRISSYAVKNTLFVLFAGLGMEPGYTANGALDQILTRIEGCEYRPGRKLWRLASQSGQPKLITKLAGRIDNLSRMKAVCKRQYFSTSHNENSGAIRINLKGREPLGKVSPGDYDEVCDTLIKNLLDIKNAETGGPLVCEVIKVREVCHGERLEWLPDLMVCWDRHAPISAIESPLIGRIEGLSSWGRTGDHAPSAMVMVSGEGVKPGKLTQCCTIADVTATLGSLQGVSLTNIDGRAFEVR